MRWTTPRVFAVAIAAGVIGAALVLTLNPEDECPEDYWPHQAQTPTQPPQAVATLLQDIFDKALTDYGNETDPITKGKIKTCVELTFECAWKDLQDQWGSDPTKTKQRADHIEAVQRAAAAVAAGDWDEANKFLEEATPIPGETIEHPH